MASERIESGGSTSTSNRVPAFAYPTPKQKEALARYVEDSSLPAPIRDGIRMHLEKGTLTFSDAWDTIFMIRKAEEARGLMPSGRSVPQGVRASEPGIYRNPETSAYIKVSISKQHRLYAMSLDVLSPGRKDESGKWLVLPKMEWRFTPGLVYKVQASWRLTPEQGKEFGDRFSTCIRCLTELTKPSSVARGMGDTCAGQI